MLVLVIDQRFATANPSFGGSEIGSWKSKQSRAVPQFLIS